MQHIEVYLCQQCDKSNTETNKLTDIPTTINRVHVHNICSTCTQTYIKDEPTKQHEELKLYKKCVSCNVFMTNIDYKCLDCHKRNIEKTVIITRPPLICNTCGLINILDDESDRLQSNIEHHQNPYTKLCDECIELKKITRKLKVCKTPRCKTFIPNNVTLCTVCTKILKDSRQCQRQC